MTTAEIREQLRIHVNEIADLRQRYLRQHGWNYTSSTPGCVWMWIKDVPRYGPIWATEDHALSIQMDLAWEEECGANEEEYGANEEEE